MELAEHIIMLHDYAFRRVSVDMAAPFHTLNHFLLLYTGDFQNYVV